MLLEIYDIEPLKNFLNMIYDGTMTTLGIKLDPDKLSINLLNNSHVAFYNLELSKDFFGEYDVSDLKELFIDLGDFYQIMKSSKKNDTLTLKSDGVHITFIFESDTNRRVFEVPFVDDGYDAPVPPSIDYTGEISVLVNDLISPCNDLDKIIGTDRFKLTVHDDLIVSAPKDSMTLYSNTINGVSTINENVSTTVNLSYIEEITKLKVNSMVTFYIGDTMPLSWNMYSDDGLVKVSGLIAPIIEDSD